MTIETIIKQLESEIKDLVLSIPSMKAHKKTDLQISKANETLFLLNVKLQMVKDLADLGAQIMPKVEGNTENIAYLIKDGKWTQMDTTSLISTIVPSWNPEFIEHLKDEPHDYAHEWRQFVETSENDLQWSKDNDGDPIEMARLEGKSQVFSEMMGLIDGFQSELSALCLANRMLVIDNQRLQHEYDSTRGLFCIDRDPKETGIKWIRKNAFQLK